MITLKRALFIIAHGWRPVRACRVKEKCWRWKKSRKNPYISKTTHYCTFNNAYFFQKRWNENKKARLEDLREPGF